jgi:hypothetical protein
MVDKIDVLNRFVRINLAQSERQYRTWMDLAAKGEAPGTVPIQYENYDEYRPGGYCDHPGRGY